MIQKEKTILHFVGIGGIGMSGIAEVFLNQGYQVTGSDMLDSDITKRLSHLGASSAPVITPPTSRAPAWS